MSAILAIIPSDERPTSDALVGRMLSRMSSRGSARAGVWREGGVVLAMSRDEWEFGAGFSGPVLIVQDGDYVVAADASLYYRDDLRRKLASKGVRPKGQTPSHLILAAYEAFGERCPEILEGDFSFILWDRKARRVVAARDFTATRPLFYAAVGSTLIVASTIAAILEHPACTDALDLPAIAVDAACLYFATDEQTAYRDVRRLNGAMTLVHARGRTRVYRHWTPIATSQRKTSLDEGAEELRVLLRDAVSERCDPDGPTSVWMSGGWDSTAVFAAGASALCQDGKRGRLAPISMALPAEDRRCETSRTAAVGTRWAVPIRWLESRDIPLLVAPQATAHQQPEPWAHLYEQMMRALARATREENARVALNGHGGDLLFASSPVVLADLLVRGQILRLWREWRAMPGLRRREFFNYAIHPVLPSAALHVAKWLRNGRPLHGYLEGPIPFWFDRKFVNQSSLAARAAAASPRASTGVSVANSEAQWLLTQPGLDRVVSTTAGFALEEGAESRLPLLDRRLVDFALGRPRWERRSSGEVKHLLRHAMRGMLPPEVLAPRPFKTGSLGRYLTDGMRRVLPELLTLTPASVLGELGIVDRVRWQQAVNTYCRNTHHDMMLSVRLLSTVQAELWLRTHTANGNNVVANFAETTVERSFNDARQQKWRDPVMGRDCAGQFPGNSCNGR
jgi:asparagine synthase (glutamine-hydrolysing)